MSPKDLNRRQRGPTVSALRATMVQVLKQCGNDLSRDNVMKEAANLKDLELPMLLPGIKINTSPDQFQPDPSDAARFFDGESWEMFGDLLPGLTEVEGRALPRARGLELGFTKFGRRRRRTPHQPTRSRSRGEAPMRPEGDRTGRDAASPSFQP